jgi:ABC-type sugar transport system ATPase subunit
MSMGGRICVMRDGNIMQVADPLTLFRQPEKHVCRRVHWQPADEPHERKDS